MTRKALKTEQSFTLNEGVPVVHHGAGVAEQKAESVRLSSLKTPRRNWRQQRITKRLLPPMTRTGSCHLLIY